MLSDSRLSSSQANLRCIGTVSNALQKCNTNKSQKVQGCQKNTYRGGGVVTFFGEQRKHKKSVACGLNTRKTTHIGCLLSSLIRDCLHHRQVFCTGEQITQHRRRQQYPRTSKFVSRSWQPSRHHHYQWSRPKKRPPGDEGTKESGLQKTLKCLICDTNRQCQKVLQSSAAL